MINYDYQQKLINYLQVRIQSSLEEVNYRIHSDKKSLPQRHLFVCLLKQCQKFIEKPRDPQWMIVVGLRGVGKTTLISQIFFELFKKHQTTINLLYINNDDVVRNIGSNTYEVLNQYQEILQTSFLRSTKPTFIFIDEVHFDPNWANAVKTFYDRGGPVFFICTGSSSLQLQMSADVIGRRARLEHLHPLSFVEFQMISSFNQNDHLTNQPGEDFKKQLITACYYSPDASTAYQALQLLSNKVDQVWREYGNVSTDYYLSYGNMPISFKEQPTVIKQSLRSMLQQTINLDITTFASFSQASLRAAVELLFILAEAGDVLDNQKLIKALKINEATLKNLYEVLTRVGLLIKTSAVGSNFSQINKPARYSFASPAMRYACQSLTATSLSDPGHLGQLLEDAAILHYQREFTIHHKGYLYWPYGRQAQADFILDITGQHRLALEFGRGFKNINQVKETMSQVKCRYGLIFSKSPLKLIKNEQIVQVPLNYFYLM